MFSPLCPPRQSQPPGPPLSTSSLVSGQKPKRDRHGRRKRRLLRELEQERKREEEQEKEREKEQEKERDEEQEKEREEEQEWAQEATSTGLVEEGEEPAEPRRKRHRRARKKPLERRLDMLRRAFAAASTVVEYDDVSSLSESEQAPYPPVRGLGFIPAPGGPLALREERRRKRQEPRQRTEEARSAAGGRPEDRRSRLGSLLLPEPLLLAPTWRPQEELRPAYRPKQQPKAYRGERAYRPPASPSPPGRARRSPSYGGFDRTEAASPPGRRRSRSPYSPASSTAIFHPLWTT